MVSPNGDCAMAAPSSAEGYSSLVEEEARRLAAACQDWDSKLRSGGPDMPEEVQVRPGTPTYRVFFTGLT